MAGCFFRVSHSFLHTEGVMPNYVYFLLAVAALIVGYIIYGGIVTRVFGVQPSRATPAQNSAAISRLSS